jgi:hypothetical protein
MFLLFIKLTIQQKEMHDAANKKETQIKELN